MVRAARVVAMLAALVAVSGVGLAGRTACAAPADPAAAQIEGFDNALLDSMKNAKALGVRGRYRQLTPVVERTFDVATMTRFAVGPPWTGMSAAQQQALVDAFGRLTIASYAHNFDGYAGERFDLDPQVQTRGVDKVVVTRLVRKGDAPAVIGYRMRQSAGAWKVIDVFYGNVSQLSTRRSDFAAPLASGGASGLLAHLNALVDKQLK
jgi:phospholipid transport system substrate-binding protein